MRPFAHQQEIVQRTWELPGFAFFWEPRVGKSLPQAMTVCALYNMDRIDAAIILAPNGVHHTWARDVIPGRINDPENNTPDQAAAYQLQVLDWMTSQASTKRFTDRAEKLLSHEGLLVVTADSNGLTSERLRTYLEKVVKKRKTLLILDESHYFKTPGAQRTRFILKLAKRCPYRRILSGTPMTSPFDLWSQFNVVDPTILGERFVPFRTRYGIFEKKFFGPRAVNIVTGYRDLEDLKKRVEPLADWKSLGDVFQNLPAVLPPERAYFELSPEHRKVYEELKNEYLLHLEQGDVTVTNPLTMLLRLQQVSRGHVTTDQGIVSLPGSSSALARLLHEVRERYMDEKIVIWCKFTEDVNAVMNLLSHNGVACVRLDGQVDQEERLKNIEAFQTVMGCRAIVGTPATGGVGVDLSAGSVMIFYSHGFNLLERLQAMSRVRGVNQKRVVSQIDLCGLNTVDERCLALLDARVDVVSKIQDHSELLNLLRSGKDKEGEA